MRWHRAAARPQLQAKRMKRGKKRQRADPQREQGEGG